MCERERERARVCVCVREREKVAMAFVEPLDQVRVPRTPPSEAGTP